MTLVEALPTYTTLLSGDATGRNVEVGADKVVMTAPVAGFITTMLFAAPEPTAT